MAPRSLVKVAVLQFLEEEVVLQSLAEEVVLQSLEEEVVLQSLAEEVAPRSLVEVVALRSLVEVVVALQSLEEVVVVEPQSPAKVVALRSLAEVRVLLVGHLELPRLAVLPRQPDLLLQLTGLPRQPDLLLQLAVLLVLPQAEPLRHPLPESLKLLTLVRHPPLLVSSRAPPTHLPLEVLACLLPQLLALPLSAKYVLLHPHPRRRQWSR